jgi:hypothetical protein
MRERRRALETIEANIANLVDFVTQGLAFNRRESSLARGSRGGAPVARGNWIARATLQRRGGGARGTLGRVSHRSTAPSMVTATRTIPPS